MDIEEELKPLSFDDENSSDLETETSTRYSKTYSEIVQDDEFVSKVRKTTGIVNQESNFIFSFGTASSGKSVILSSMLYAMQIEYGVLSPKIGTPNSKEAEVLLADFFDNMAQGVLPERTDRDKVTRMDLVFKPNNKSKKVTPADFTFLEASGENWNEIRRGGALHSSIDTYLSADVSLTFMLVTGYNSAHKEDSILKEFLFLLEKKRHHLKNTNIILIVSKWDKSGSENVLSEEELENFIKERLPMTNNFLETYGLDKTYYTIGELYLDEQENKEKVRYLNLDSAKRLSKWLYKSVKGYDLEYEGTFWEQLKWSLGMN
ncbi:MAG: hypothetical protein KGV44_14290 [Flavobacteriaceae bacterium]|nr:hypothetical protein [Flavobacteriaceae bacterium]